MKRLLILPLLTLLLSCSAKADLADCKAGIEANGKKEYLLAIESLTKCLNLPLKNEAQAYILAERAGAYFNTKQYNLAIDDQKQAIVLEKPKDVWPLLMLGAYYREVKEFDKSLEAINAAFNYDEDGPGTGAGMAVYYHKARTLYEAGRYNEAIESYTLGIPKQPDYGYALYERGRSYEAVGNKDMAKRDMFRAFELTPQEGYEPEIAAKLKEYGFNAKIRSD
ncbi:MAG: tetratricopeptide repeat protein [Methylophilaceae bacterium]|nr:hypothetical protein [Methyloradius sp.]